MHDNRWRNGFALGLTVGSLAAILAALALSIVPDELSYAGTHQNEGDQPRPQDGRWWWLGRVVFAEDSAAQWLMAGFTVVATILLLRTLWATQDMARETTRIGEAQVQVYVSLKSATYYRDEIGNNISNVTIVNSGQSPALFVSVSCAFDFLNHDDGTRRRLGVNSVRELLGDIPSNDTATYELTREPVVIAGKGTMTVHIQVRWRSVFDPVVGGKDRVRRCMAAGYFDCVDEGPHSPVELKVYSMPFSERTGEGAA